MTHIRPNKLRKANHNKLNIIIVSTIFKISLFMNLVKTITTDANLVDVTETSTFN